MKYDFKVEVINRYDATEFVQARHYSKVMPGITKHFLGIHWNDKLVGVLTLGLGTQPRATIAKLFEWMGVDDYFEIGKMCMDDDLEGQPESQMISAVVSWIKENHPSVSFLYTWADGIMGKPGFVYQASNFLYGGFIWTKIYISKDGEKIHPRSSGRLCAENAKFEEKRNPNFFDGKKQYYIIEYNDSVKYYTKDEAGRESAINFCKRKKVEFKDKVAGRIFWLTQDFLDANMISSISGKQFRYILPLNKKSRKLLDGGFHVPEGPPTRSGEGPKKRKKSSVDWVVSGPKKEDLIWTKSTKDGKLVLDGMPYINKDETSYNKKNVEGHKKSSDLREFFA